MAKILEDFEFKRGRGNKYPIEKWADGSIWELTKGEDYTCSEDSIRSSLGAFTKGLSGKFRTTCPEEGVLVIQYVAD